MDTRVLDINQCILSIYWLICVSIQWQTWFTQTRPKTWLFWHWSVCLWYYLPDNQDLWSHKFCFLSFVVAILSASRHYRQLLSRQSLWDPGNVKSFTMHYTPEHPLLLMNIVCSPHLFPTLRKLWLSSKTNWAKLCFKNCHALSFGASKSWLWIQCLSHYNNIIIFDLILLNFKM